MRNFVEKNNLKEKILEIYIKVEDKIKERIKEFSSFLPNSSDERIFAELAFCICTPRTKAKVAWEAIEKLYRNGVLFYGKEEEILKNLNGIRFADKKAKYILKAREKFTKDGKLFIKKFILNFKDPFRLREWLVDNIDGLGMKESSHFLRNIGLGFDFAILDIHVLRSLKDFGIIDDIPRSLTKRRYLEIEERMRNFSKELKIPLVELDLLLWYMNTGYIFK